MKEENMSVSNENFGTGEKMSRTRHEIVFTVDSPNSISKEMNLSEKHLDLFSQEMNLL